VGSIPIARSNQIIGEYGFSTLCYWRLALAAFAVAPPLAR
jgi:hypothetical protein